MLQTVIRSSNPLQCRRHLAKRHKHLPVLIPKGVSCTAEALDQSQPSDGGKLRVVLQYLWQPVIRNPTAQMMDVVHANVSCKPTQDVGQVIMRAASQRGFVKFPALLMGPECILKLVLDIEQPDTDRGGKKRDR